MLIQLPLPDRYDLCVLAFLSQGNMPGEGRYSTSLAVLALTTPYQLLPIFQR